MSNVKSHWAAIADYVWIAVNVTPINGQRRSVGKMFNPHRPTVMTIPDRLRPVMKDDRNQWKIFMDSAIKALNDTLSYSLRKEVLAGAIVVLHPFERHLGFNPHIHLRSIFDHTFPKSLLRIEGGFDKSKKFIHCRKWKSRYNRYLSHSRIKKCKIDEIGDK